MEAASSSRSAEKHKPSSLSGIEGEAPRPKKPPSKLSALDEIMREQEEKREQANRRAYWVTPVSGRQTLVHLFTHLENAADPSRAGGITKQRNMTRYVSAQARQNNGQICNAASHKIKITRHIYFQCTSVCTPNSKV